MFYYSPLAQLFATTVDFAIVKYHIVLWKNLIRMNDSVKVIVYQWFNKIDVVVNNGVSVENGANYEKKKKI